MSNESQVIEGELHEVGLPRVLQTLSARQSTGILTIQGEEDIVAVSYLNGNIVTADALNQTLEDGLGEVLASQGLIEKEAFATVARDHQGSGGSLGDMLVERDLISRDKLLEVLRLHTYRLMLRVLGWRQGEFKFYGGDEVAYEKGVVPISVDEILIRSLADLGEQSGVGGEVPKLEAIYRQVPPRGEVRIHGRDGDGEGPGIWINGFQASFLEGCDGRATAIQIAKSLGAGRYKTLFALHQLLQNDLIELVQIIERRRPAAARKPSSEPAKDGGPVSRPPAPWPSAGGAPASQLAGPAAPLPPPSGQVTRPSPAQPAAARPAAARPAAARKAPSTPATSRSAPARSAPQNNRGAGAVLTQAARQVPRSWSGPVLAGSLLLGFLFAFAESPSTVLLPFPWQEAQRATAERQVRQSLFLKIDRAVRTYRLTENRYPESLEELVDRRLLSIADLHDTSGATMRYSGDGQSYQINLTGEEAEVGMGTTGSVAGDLLLDSAAVSSEEVANPLYLID